MTLEQLAGLTNSLGVSAASFTADMAAVFDAVDTFMAEQDAEISRLKAALDNCGNQGPRRGPPIDDARIAELRRLVSP